MDIIETVERLRLLPNASIDCSFRQGREAMSKQLRQRDELADESLTDASIEDAQNTIASMIQRSSPYRVPEDYVFFLEFYGGLRIVGDNYYFSVLGVGPMVEDWYASIDSDRAFPEPGRYGFLSLGSLSFDFQHVDFFLDLSGVAQKHSVIGIGPWGPNDVSPSTIVKDLHTYPGTWKKLADSFREWLGLVAATHGTSGYV